MAWLRLWPVKLCVLALILVFAGCLESDKTALTSYDPTKDEFHCLLVLQHIHGSQQQSQFGPNNAPTTQPAPEPISEDDVRWLKSLYANRDNIIIPPAFIDIGGMTAFLRLDDKDFAAVNLGQESRTLQAAVSEIPLKQFKIESGQFVLPEPGNLCYYYQLRAPGKAVDQILAIASRSLADPKDNMLVKSIDGLLSSRASGQPTMPWDEFTALILDRIDAQERGAAPATQPQITCPLDSASLKLIKDALLGGKIAIVRHAKTVSVSVPLTPADVAGVLNCVKSVRADLRAALVRHAATAPGHGKSQDNAQLRVLDALVVAGENADHMRVSLDLVEALNALNPDPLNSSELPENDREKLIANAQVDAKAVDAKTDLSLDQIVQQFKADKLAANSAATPVPPGLGMGTIKPVAPANSTPPAEGPATN